MTETVLENQSFLQRVRFRGQPIANPDSIVVSGNARFTILTSHLIRLEWSETSQFEDRGSFAFPTRFAPAPSFRCHTEGGVLSIDTGPLALRYERDGEPFGAGNLRIAFELDGECQTWVPGMSNRYNLRGTRRTLDGCYGDATLEEGLLSRAGWSLFDDSHSVVFDSLDGWVVPRPDHGLQDWYFFGYGHDYKLALSDYMPFGGQIPLVPRFALGAWWSRYWEYSDQDLKELVGDFEGHDIPLDVLVIDMDWHTPHSWTGYTWNRELFPDPPAFLRWVHERGLRVSLNLHPAEGVQRFEEVYTQFARAMGLDPESKDSIPFRIADRIFVKHYFELLHHPLEEDGVDFWWVDWQQGETSEIKGLDPLPWLNHLHFSDSRRRGLRPMVFSRWGGLGNHRYQMGFSGDTWVGWPALQFQPYFTATASNVAYGWWGHDIGGHMGDATEPELYARWVQFGALSPCLRLHATKDPHAERRPWKYPEKVFLAARDAFRLRYQLLPYIYTMARIAHDSGVSLCRPMYHEYPEADAAYRARYQYFFGDEMIVAPIVQPSDPRTGLAATDVWLPEGTWIDYQTRELFDGPRWVRLVGDLSRVPILVKAGAILPLSVPFQFGSPTGLASGTTDSIPRDQLILSVFPGAYGSFHLYEDDGTTEAYREGQFEWTQIETRMSSPDVWEVQISPVDGRCDALPAQRGYEIRLEGSRPPDKVLLDGVELPDWHYDAGALRITLHIPSQDKRMPISVTAVAAGGMSALGEAHNRQVVLSDISRLVGDRFLQERAGKLGPGEIKGKLLDAVLRTEGPGQADAVARLGGPLVRFLEFTTPEEASQQLGCAIFGAPALSDTAVDLDLTWTLFQGGETKEYTIQIEGMTESQLLEAPFTFDGQVQTSYWTAEARLTWAGMTLTQTHRSNILFPFIHTWRAVVYEQAKDALTWEQVVDERGTLNGELDWQAHVQTTEALVNVNQPHGILFSRQYRQELQAGLPLAAYMTTLVVSPDERDAILQFRSAGPAEIVLNGRRIEVLPVEAEEEILTLIGKERRTTVMQLHAGRNTLVVHTRPSEAKRTWWHFGGAFKTPDGDLMTDLAFE